MTESEIMKALECCRTNIMADCKRCNLRLEDGTIRPYCTTILIGNALDLINRKNAENEKVRTELDRLTIYFDEAVEAKLKTARAEAIKEVFQAIDFMCIDTFGNFNHKAFINLKKEMGCGE